MSLVNDKDLPSIGLNRPSSCLLQKPGKTEALLMPILRGEGFPSVVDEILHRGLHGQDMSRIRRLRPGRLSSEWCGPW